ncbi:MULTISPECIES: helix-turn-helix domain-containing protein [Streptomyces]|uniref:helix-turn-helix domain-containing protein n=1 Tax=Streptomyces TaxID=1883 RepID=UPI00163CACF2|nr:MULTISPECIES: helix-turn-helix transcriptional regulator [Streptomyces]MBC2876861.1 helix-turn-helix transcriptional regulator [Streptomyces sp. TYQ1024]UBI35890.1 helix-turn-helix domain-containing protein [Streptomyces mobaraensis]UKW28484.1 helix-turn-helix domain-containing protein [Streptomyces sp. TYQ1024]
MSDFADLARRALRDSGYSMKAAARAMNYDAAYLSRVLNGKQNPSAKLAASVDELVGAGGALAATVLDDDKKSRVTRSAANPSRLDAGTVDALAGVLAAYRRLDDSVEPKSVIPATMTQVKEVTRILRGARGPYRDRLAEVVSEWVQFGGWMLAQVRKDDQAVGLLNDALELADEIGNGTLAAQALNFKGYIARQQNRPQGIARWFSAAANTPGAHPAQRIGDYLQAAAGMASLGERDAALRLVEDAEKLTDKAASLPPPDTAYWLTPAFNRLNMGLCTLELGRYSEATDHLRSGLAGLPEELRDAPWSWEHKDALRRAVEAA